MKVSRNVLKNLSYTSNPTHGSGWIVQVQPTNEYGSIASSNPTHGSGWIVQVQPANEGGLIASSNPTHAVGGSFKSSLQRKAA
jgi:glycine cleavage system H lipoate-binding protein